MHPHLVSLPARIVRFDSDDPYLWLDDAFASGGSAATTTRRGAWESVKRHFRELGIDAQTTDFTFVGDISGDVFGNGMLRSRRIRLLAATTANPEPRITDAA